MSVQVMTPYSDITAVLFKFYGRDLQTANGVLKSLFNGALERNQISFVLLILKIKAKGLDSGL